MIAKWLKGRQIRRSIRETIGNIRGNLISPVASWLPLVGWLTHDAYALQLHEEDMYSVSDTYIPFYLGLGRIDDYDRFVPSSLTPCHFEHSASDPNVYASGLFRVWGYKGVGQKWPHTPQWGRGLYRGARPPSNRVLENKDRYINIGIKEILVIIDF